MNGTVSPTRIPLNVSATRLMKLHEFHNGNLAFIMRSMAILVAFRTFFHVCHTRFFSFTRTRASRLSITRIRYLSNRKVLRIQDRYSSFVTINDDYRQNAM